MFLLVPVQTGCPGHNPYSCKTVVCDCVCVCVQSTIVGSGSLPFMPENSVDWALAFKGLTKKSMSILHL